MNKSLIATLVFIFISSFLYISLGYFTVRQDFIDLISQVGLLYIFLMLIYNTAIKSSNDSKIFRNLMFAGMLFRLLLLFSIPNLSDDFYRFIWDGQLGLNGLSPYLLTPMSMAQGIELTSTQSILLEHMNSPNYLSVYPPLNQYIFQLATVVSPNYLLGQIILLKLILLASELTIIFILPRLLKSYGLPIYGALLYILNPLVIFETIGNLHFESLTISFLVLFLYFFGKSKTWISFTFYALAVHVKLLPLILIPALLKLLGWKNWIRMLLVLSVVTLVLAMPFYSVKLVEQFMQGIGVYFNSFEFNASIYYLVRYFGFIWKGYNIIHIAGISLAILSGISIVLLAIRYGKGKLTFVQVGMWSFIIFYLLSTTIHPWYVINVLIFSILAGMPYAVTLWSFLAFFSYAAYATTPFEENLVLVTIEYTLFLSCLLFEYLYNRRIDFN